MRRQKAEPRRRMMAHSRSRRWPQACPHRRVLLSSRSRRCGGTQLCRMDARVCRTHQPHWNGFVRCMGTGDRSEVMNRSLQKYVIHLDGSHPLPTRNSMKRCAWCSLCDSRVACNMNFRSCRVPRSGRSGSEHVSKENM